MKTTGEISDLLPSKCSVSTNVGAFRIQGAIDGFECFAILLTFMPHSSTCDVIAIPKQECLASNRSLQYELSTHLKAGSDGVERSFMIYCRLSC